jgi:DNA repair protein RecO (recombination protein O)
MRHRYETRGIVLSRAPLGEANALITLITPELGLVRARAQSVRRPGAKLAPGLATFAESSLILMRGKEGWRAAGAVLEENWFTRLPGRPARVRAARIGGLLLRFSPGETQDAGIFAVIRGFFEALALLPESEHEAAEILAALRILAALGLDAGDIPGEVSEFTAPLLAQVGGARPSYITRINRGIAASGL